jgi:hypothetical protein
LKTCKSQIQTAAEYVIHKQHKFPQMTKGLLYISDFIINLNQIAIMDAEILLKLILVMAFCMVVFGWSGEELPA